ncbi:hypothetical protein B0H11DRAFT_2416332 [Mycena galericulata]|nr:hypothetical protein B0H11DRAFT_2416332 [Mycena galericulata]
METVYHVGAVPNFAICRRNGITWVALNCDPGCIPGDAWESVDRVWYYSRKFPSDANGFFKSGEWSKIADWQRPDRYWTEWIPTVMTSSPDPLPWYHIEDHPTAIKKTQYGRFLIEVAVRDMFVAGLKEAWEVVSELVSSNLFPSSSATPIEANYNDLYFAKDSAKEAFELVVSAKRKMLEFLGMINWWTSVIPRWESLVKPATVSAIHEYCLKEYGKRGVLINLARDRHNINLPLLLKRDVLIMYAWTIKEDVNPMFAKLVPLLLNANQKKKRLVKADFLVADEDFFKSEDYEYLFSFTIMLEAFPPADVEAPDIYPKKLKESWAYFMIDSEGYGRRPVLDRGWQLYYAYRYHYEILGDPKTDDATVIFYRLYRKEENKVDRYIGEGSDYDPDEEVLDYEDSTSDDDVAPSDTTRDALDNDFLVWELSRIKYAPRPGQRFDPRTGLELEKPWSGSNTLSRWSAELLKAVPTSPDSLEFTRTRNAIKRVIKIIEDGIPERMDVDEVPGSSAVSPPAYSVSPEMLETPAGPGTEELPKQSENTEPDFIPLPSISLLDRMSDEGGSRNISRGIPTAPRAHRDRDQFGRRTNSRTPSSASRHSSSDQYRQSRSHSRSRNRSASPRHSEFYQRGSRSHLPPRRPSPQHGGYRKPNEEQMEKIQSWTSSDLAKAIPSPVGAALPLVRNDLWNFHLIKHGFLVLREPASRVIARHWAMTDPQIKSVKDLMRCFMEYGIEFAVAILERDTGLFAPDVGLRERKLGGAIYSQDSTEDPLTWGNGGREFCVRWGRRTDEILGRDHARSLVAKGGTLAWIAHQNSRDTLTDVFSNGPSKQVTIHRGGLTDLADQDHIGLVQDTMLAAEVNVLLGKIHGEDKWIYPPTEFLWDFSSHYSGVLNEPTLNTLSLIQAEVERNEPKLRSRSDFRELFRSSNRSSKYGEARKMSREEYATAEANLQAIFVDNWCKMPLRDVVLPGYRVAGLLIAKSHVTNYHLLSTLPRISPSGSTYCARARRPWIQVRKPAHLYTIGPVNLPDQVEQTRACTQERAGVVGSNHRI